MTETRDTVILGSGCAGLTAAIYTARAGLKPIVLEGHEPGGQLSITTLVENFPGWPDGIQGPELIENMKTQAARFGAELQTAHLVAADLHAHPFHLKTSHGDIHTRSVIIASGASARWLGLHSEQALILGDGCLTGAAWRQTARSPPHLTQTRLSATPLSRLRPAVGLIHDVWARR